MQICCQNKSHLIGIRRGKFSVIQTVFRWTYIYNCNLSSQYDFEYVLKREVRQVSLYNDLSSHSFLVINFQWSKFYTPSIWHRFYCQSFYWVCIFLLLLSLLFHSFKFDIVWPKLTWIFIFVYTAEELTCQFNFKRTREK